jgi:hypothetical protein
MVPPRASSFGSRTVGLKCASSNERKDALMSEQRKAASDSRIRASEETLRELRDLAAEHSPPGSDLRQAGFDDLADRIASLVDAFEGDHIEFGREEQRRQAQDDTS